MNLPKTIALDGPAGSGKSSVAFVIASEYGYLFIDTGAFYRTVSLAIIRAHALDADEATITAIARRAYLDISSDQNADDRHYTMWMDGKDVTWAIRDPVVERHVSRIAAMSSVREVLNTRFRELAHSHDLVIMAGRDIGTVVLPDADLKIYLDASLDTRAERRYKQAMAAGNGIDFDDTQAAIAGRDQQDSQRPVAPLRLAPDAHYLNTDDMDVRAVTAFVKALIEVWKVRHSNGK